MRHVTTLAAITVSLFLSLGCEASEDNQISKGLACLDGADRTNAADCAEITDGLETPQAYAIRCSADFISEGFDTLTMAKAYSQVSDSGGSTAAMLGILVFSSTAKVTQTAALCAKAGVPSMALLASLAKTATLITSVCSISGSGSCTFDPTADREAGFPTQGLQDALDFLADPANDNDTVDVKTSIGSAVIVAYDQQCATEANKTSDMCKDIVAAMAVSRDPLAIAEALIAKLKQP